MHATQLKNNNLQIKLKYFFLHKICQHSYSGKAADIWALGATLYSLVFGNVPFIASNVPSVYEKIKHESLQFPRLPKISEELKDLLENMLNKNPGKRITLPQVKVSQLLFSN